MNENHIVFILEWEIAAYTSPYKYRTRRCNTYLKKKYFFVREDTFINKRTKLMKKYCHRNKLTIAKVNKLLIPGVHSY